MSESRRASFEFVYPILARVSFGRGILAAQLMRQLDLLGAARPVVVISRSLSTVADVTDAVAVLRRSRLSVETFVADMRHCPSAVASELARCASAHRADALLTIGGSSVSDTAKAARLLAATEFVPLQALAARIEPLTHLPWPLVAVPTTLSGGEFTPVVGITDESTRHKQVLRHPGLCASAVVLEVELQRHTPDELWASTGMKLLDHAIERLLARNRLPLIDAQCIQGVRWLLPLLPQSMQSRRSEAEAMAARGRLLQALWVIQSSHGNVGTGLSHALSHQLGSAVGLDHGCGSVICLPVTLAHLQATGRLDQQRLDLLADAFSIPPDELVVETVLTRLAELTRSLGLPTNLAEAGIAALPNQAIAEAVLADPTLQGSPGRPFEREEVEALLATLTSKKSRSTDEVPPPRAQQATSNRRMHCTEPT